MPDKTVAAKPYLRLSGLAKALAHPTRLQILHLLTAGEACVCHLTAILKKRQANVSQHLMVLREAELVVDRKDGLIVYYRLADPRVAQIVELLHKLASSQGELTLPEAPTAPVPGCPCPKCEDAGCGLL